ncbi:MULTISPECIES: alpha/beta fold hydrolase [Spirulina sp. CCY15215]|uniref:alpha/beta fold hydrolase n=1 Tax=Spirulina sp. CCY15215 TaxID=2767591 RepID=UPI0019505CD6|nr:alpha/beta fold hydrolase [Spirulina major]
MVATAKPTDIPLLTPLDWQWQGHNIRYTEMGEGEPLLLIHGFGASVGHWRKNIPVLAAAGYRAIAIDLLGFGASAKPNLDYSVELWQQQLFDFWQEKIKTPTVFIGNSIGGLLSLMMLGNHPELARGGVLINCAGGLNHRPEELNFPLRTIMGIFTKIVGSPLMGSFLFNRIRQKNRIRRTLGQVYRDRTAITEELVEMLYRPSCDRGAREVFASVLTAPPGPKPEDLLLRVQCPLLVLWGDADPWTPIAGAKIYQDLAQTNPDVTFYPITAAGHCPHDENPDRVNQFMLEFLANESSMTQ